MNPILVLGSRVVDGRVDTLLASRLNRAAELSGRDPHLPVVVSGLGEAAPMADYLRGLGVQNLIEEPHATSTNENLENAHALLPDTPRWTVVTSDFHACRTYLWAWHLGIPITVVTARTPLSVRSQMFLREMIALPHSALRVVWRKIVG